MPSTISYFCLSFFIAFYLTSSVSTAMTLEQYQSLTTSWNEDKTKNPRNFMENSSVLFEMVKNEEEITREDLKAIIKDKHLTPLVFKLGILKLRTKLAIERIEDDKHNTLISIRHLSEVFENKVVKYEARKEAAREDASSKRMEAETKAAQYEKEIKKREKEATKLEASLVFVETHPKLNCRMTVRERMAARVAHKNLQKIEMEKFESESIHTRKTVESIQKFIVSLKERITSLHQLKTIYEEELQFKLNTFDSKLESEADLEHEGINPLFKLFHPYLGYVHYRDLYQKLGEGFSLTSSDLQDLTDRNLNYYNSYTHPKLEDPKRERLIRKKQQLQDLFKLHKEASPQQIENWLNFKNRIYQLLELETQRRSLEKELADAETPESSPDWGYKEEHHPEEETEDSKVSLTFESPPAKSWKVELSRNAQKSRLTLNPIQEAAFIALIDVLEREGSPTTLIDAGGSGLRNYGLLSNGDGHCHLIDHHKVAIWKLYRNEQRIEIYRLGEHPNNYHGVLKK